MNYASRLRQIAVLLAAVHVIGVGGYMLIEDWPFLDALYMTIITLGTVGYGETQPLDRNGRIFTMFFIVIGIGAFTYAISTVVAFTIESQLFDKWGRRRMERKIAEMRNHIVLCGGGDSAMHIARELKQTRTPYVVIEIDPGREAALRQLDEDMLIVIGDASDTDILERAGTPHARGLISCLPDDKDNLFVVIQARDLNESMRVVTRIRHEHLRPKLERAGADAIVSSQRIGALRIASEMLRPHVVTVLDVMLRQPGDIRVQEIPIGQDAAGKTIHDLDLPKRVGVIPFAMREAGNMTIHFNPPSNRVLNDGDVLIACADPAQLESARHVATSG